jgi:hypothetical protein
MQVPATLHFDILEFAQSIGGTRSLTVRLAFVVLSCCGVARAQDQFLPEIDVYDKLNSNVRFDFQAKDTRESGDPTQAEVGPSFDFYFRPLLKLKKVTAFDLDDAKARPLQLSVGFRNVPSPDKPHLERMIVAFTSNFPLGGNFLLSDRNPLISIESGAHLRGDTAID